MGGVLGAAWPPIGAMAGAMSQDYGQALRYAASLGQRTLSPDERRLLEQAQLAREYESRRVGLGPAGKSVVKSETKIETKERGVMNYVKEYFVKHREILMGLGMVILLDHFLLDGALSEKLKRILHGILDKTEQKLLAE